MKVSFFITGEVLGFTPFLLIISHLSSSFSNWLSIWFHDPYKSPLYWTNTRFPSVPVILKLTITPPQHTEAGSSGIFIDGRWSGPKFHFLLHFLRGTRHWIFWIRCPGQRFRDESHSVLALLSWINMDCPRHTFVTYLCEPKGFKSVSCQQLRFPVAKGIDGSFLWC